MKSIHRFVGVAGLAAVVTFVELALASVSNPELYQISNPVGRVHQFAGKNGKTISAQANDWIEGDVDGGGTWAFNAWGAGTFPVVSTGILTSDNHAISAQLKPQSNSSGSFLYSPALDVDLTVTFRIDFTWSGQSGSPCRTPNFTATLSTTKTFNPTGYNPISGSPYNTSNGLYIMNASDFSIGSISTSHCDSAANRAILEAFFKGNSGDLGIIMSPYTDQLNDAGVLMAP